MVDGNCNHAAERKAADVRASDSELVHCRQDGRRIIVAAGPCWRRIAVPVAWIVEGDCPPGPPEMRKLRSPHRFVGADPVEEDDRGSVAAACFFVADGDVFGGLDAGHHPSLASCRTCFSIHSMP